MLDPKPQPLALANSLGDSSLNRGGLMLPPVVNGGEAGQVPAALSASPTVSGIMQALRRRWLLALGLASLGAVLTVLAVLHFFPAYFVAHSRIQVASRQEQNLFTPTGHEEDFTIYKASLAALIKSPLVINAALNEVKDLSLVRSQAKPVAWLETALKTDYLLAPEILRLSLGGDDPEEVAKIVNAVATAFLKEIEQKEKVKRQIRLEELKENYRQALETLNQKRRVLRGREKAENLEDLATLQTRYQAALHNLNATKKTVLDKRLEQIHAQEELKASQAKLKNLDRLPIPALQLDEVLKQHPIAQKFYLDLAETEKHIYEIRTRGEKNSVNRLLEPYFAHRKNQEKSLADLREQLRPDLEAKIRQDTADRLSLQIHDFQDRINSLKKQEELLSKEVRILEEEAQRLSPASSAQPLDVVALRDDIARMETSLNKLGEMIAAVKVEPLLGMRVTLLQRAEVPSARDTKQQMRLAGVAGISMFGLLLFGVGWWEFRARRISSAEEVVSGLHMGLVGTLPAWPVRGSGTAGNGQSPRDLYWQSQLTEAVDGIRTLLLHAARTEALNVVMVTSAMEGEGKTSVASQLAASLARAWRKTLLIDADLRKPAAHLLFGLPQEPGLSEVLRGEVKPADVIRPTTLSRLWLMSAGHWDAHTVQALAQENVGEMLKGLKEQYDFIILDSSPILPVADSLLLSQHVEGVIFSVLRDVSRLPAVYAAQQRLSQLGVRILGAVVNGEQSNLGSLAHQYLAKATS